MIQLLMYKTEKEITGMITGKQRSELKKLAQELKPAVMIGKDEVTPAVIQSIDDYLTAHELVKVQIAQLHNTERCIDIV